METETLFCGGSKITAAGDIGHEIRRPFVLEENYDQIRHHIKKQRHYFVNKVHLVKAMVFSVVMYGCESWTIRKLSTEELMLLNCDIGEDS